MMKKKNILIANKKVFKIEENKAEGIFYIGRPSILGNKFTHLKNTIAEVICNSREDSIKRYENWLYDKMKTDAKVLFALKEIRDEYKKGNEIILVCWCKPEKCHGDIIKKVIENNLVDLVYKKFFY